MSFLVLHTLCPGLSWIGAIHSEGECSSKLLNHDKSTRHLPCIPQEDLGNLVCTHWLGGSSIRSHYSSFHLTGLHNHLSHHRDSSQRCSDHWSTWRRSRCTSFLKRARHSPVTATTPCNFSTKLGNAFDLTMDLDRLIPFKEALLVVVPFVSAICPRQFPGRVVLLVTLMKRFQLWAKQQSYLQPGIWGSEAVRQSGRDSLHSHHIPTESWEDSGHPCSEIPLIHRSDRLREERQMLFHPLTLWLSSDTASVVQVLTVTEWKQYKARFLWPLFILQWSTLIVYKESLHNNSNELEV